MIDSGEDEDKFEKFMQPLTSKYYRLKFHYLKFSISASMDTLKSMLSNKSLFGQEETKVCQLFTFVNFLYSNL